MQFNLNLTTSSLNVLSSVLNQTGQLAVSIFLLLPYLINTDSIKGDEGSIYKLHCLHTYYVPVGTLS